MKFIITKKQKIIGLSFLGLLLIISLSLIIFDLRSTAKLADNQNRSALKPVFLTNVEKTALNINPETKIQVIKKDTAGNLMLYKVIKNDADIVTDLKKLEPNPPQKK